jgi:hypothetical protein
MLQNNVLIFTPHINKRKVLRFVCVELTLFGFFYYTDSSTALELKKKKAMLGFELTTDKQEQ